MKEITYDLNVEYASQAVELNGRIPYGYVNKKICGCGLTSLAIENDRNTIVAVPNKELAINKSQQYPNDRFSGKLLSIVGGVSKEVIDKYMSENKIKKVMVTYDSLWKVEKYIDEGFDLVIDESEQLLKSQGLKLSDKSDIKELDVLTKLFQICERNKERVSFISATPIKVDYLPKWISQLDQVTINWSGTTKAKAYLMERTYPFKSLREEIINPLCKNGSITINDIVATKVIIFINSVSNILKIAKECELDSADVALIVGDNLSNDVKIKGYDRLERPDKLPKFTFITSIGFQGIDLYDKEALSVVVSNTNKSFTMIDMMTDLKQAISRQRIKDNLNYGKYVFVYNQNMFSKTEEELLLNIYNVEKAILQAIEIHKLAKESNNMEGFELLANDSRDFKMYTVYNYDKDIYELNEMAFNADKYLIIELRNQFTKGFDIRSSIELSEEVSKVELQKDVQYVDLVNYFKSIPENNRENINWATYSTRKDWIDIIEKCWKLYNKYWANITVARKMIANYNDENAIVGLEISQLFSVGKKYLSSYVKDKLNSLFVEKNIKRKGKCTDLHSYFEIKDVKIKGERGIEVLSRR